MCLSAGNCVCVRAPCLHIFVGTNSPYGDKIPVLMSLEAFLRLKMCFNVKITVSLRIRVRYSYLMVRIG